MNVYKYESYKDFVNDYVRSLPKGGHGEFKKIADSLRAHTTTISQIFKGEKHLTLDQSHKLSLHFGLNELETEYFITLTLLERESGHQFRTFLLKRLRTIKSQALQAKNYVRPDTELKKAVQAKFYSHWYYAALNLLSEKPGGITAEEVAPKLNLPLSVVREALDFLVLSGLNQKNENRYISKKINTHVEKESPLANRHHINWRLKAVEAYANIKDTDLAFTAPLTISREDALAVKQIILNSIKKISEKVASSGSESLYCFNIDWLEMTD